MHIRSYVQTFTALFLAATMFSAHAGNVFLTGHDVDLHDGQSGYDSVILNWLAGGATPIAPANYKVGLIRSIDNINPATGFVGGLLAGPPLWVGGVTEADPTQFANGAAFGAFLGTVDVLVIASFTGCGGCDLSAGDSTVLNSFAPEIAAFFNAGGDIWGNAGDGLASYYGFLPPSAVAIGASIGAETGFLCTAAGAALPGIDCDAGESMINGFPTHNRFTSAANIFTVFEVRPIGGGSPDEIISIGVRDITTSQIPEPGSLALISIAALGIAWSRRRQTH